MDLQLLQTKPHHLLKGRSTRARNLPIAPLQPSPAAVHPGYIPGHSVSCSTAVLRDLGGAVGHRRSLLGGHWGAQPRTAEPLRLVKSILAPDIHLLKKEALDFIPCYPCDAASK